jgi:hypothetical protein
MIFLKAILHVNETQNEIKRATFAREPEELSFQELENVIQRMFGTLLKLTDPFTLKYMDEDRDLVTLESGNDIIHALTVCSNQLKIHIFPTRSNSNSKPIESHEEHVNVLLASMKSQLENFQKENQKVTELALLEMKSLLSSTKALVAELQNSSPAPAPSAPNQTSNQSALIYSHSLPISQYQAPPNHQPDNTNVQSRHSTYYPQHQAHMPTYPNYPNQNPVQTYPLQQPTGTPLPPPVNFR